MNVSTNSSTKTVEVALDHYENHKAVALVAPMQSGKTDTFLEIGKKMVEYGKVNNVVVFCANNETLLKDQTVDCVNELEMQSYCQVVFGTKMKKFVPKPFTFYIWDEAHYGQSINQMADEFSAKCGICTAGVNNDSAYLLCVSATPFSQNEDAKDSNTLMIFQEPSYGKCGDPYYGVPNMLSNGKIKTFVDFETCAKERIDQLKSSSEPKIGIVRLYGKEAKFFEQLCKENDLQYDLYDASCENRKLKEALNKQPSKSRVIAVKGKVRMGFTIDNKMHFLWTLENSKHGKTDTRMQGLIGRFCGYEHNLETEYWVPKKGLQSAKEYCYFLRTEGKSPPKSGMNLKYSSKRTFENAQYKFPDSVKIKSMLEPKIDQDKLKEYCKSLGIPSLNCTKFSNRTNMKSQTFIEGKAVKVAEGCGTTSGTGDATENANIFLQGDDYWLLYAKKVISCVTTTGKELFAKPLEESSAVSQPIKLHKESYSNELSMMKDILEIIERTNGSDLFAKKINISVPMTKEVYNSLVCGIIHKHVKRLYGMIIKIPNVKDETPLEVIVDEINW